MAHIRLLIKNSLSLIDAINKVRTLMLVEVVEEEPVSFVMIFFWIYFLVHCNDRPLQ